MLSGSEGLRYAKNTQKVFCFFLHTRGSVSSKKTCPRPRMALFGDQESDVGPFVMTEDGEEWFPFTLDNLEMDRGCAPLDQDSTAMEQVRLLGIARLAVL